MFSSQVSIVPIWSDAAELFPHIKVLHTRSEDQTIIYTLRALLEPRLDKEDSPTVTYYEHSSLLEQDYRTPWAFNLISDHILTDEELDNLNKCNWTQLSDIEDFIASKAGVQIRIFVNTEINSTIIVGSDIDAKAKHIISFFVPRYYRKLFENNKPDATEMEMLNSLLGITSRKYMAAMEKLAEKRDLVAKASAIKIATAGKLFMERSIRNAENDLDTAERTVQNAVERYQSALKERFAKSVYLEGLRSKLDKGEYDKNEELYDFILDNKHIRVLCVSANGQIEIMIHNYLDIYDADGFENFNARFFGQVAGDTHGWEADDVAKVLKATFAADPVFRVRICAYYNLDIGGYCNTERGYDYHEPDRIPNPHLYRHACLGQNEGEICRCLRDGNLIGAIMQCNASAMSVNVHETGATFRPFCSELLTTNAKVFELPDGTRMNAKEALAYLNEKEAQAE